MDVLASGPVQVSILIDILLTLSLLFPFLAGVWSIGMPGFMCIGAYVAAVATTEYGVSVGVAIVISALAAMAACLPFALLAFRIRHIYLAIATLSASELILLFFSHSERFGGVGGYVGMPYLPVGTIALVTLIIVALCFLIYLSRFGTAIAAAGIDPLVASCNGVNVRLTQMLALLIGAALGGIGGALYAHYYGFISPATFGFHLTANILMFLVIGGLTPQGAIIGAAILGFIPQYITGLKAWAPALYAAVLILSVAFAPAGLLPRRAFARLASKLRHRIRPKSDVLASALIGNSNDPKR